MISRSTALLSILILLAAPRVYGAPSDTQQEQPSCSTNDHKGMCTEDSINLLQSFVSVQKQQAHSNNQLQEPDASGPISVHAAGSKPAPADGAADSKPAAGVDDGDSKPAAGRTTAAVEGPATAVLDVGNELQKKGWKQILTYVGKPATRTPHAKKGQETHSQAGQDWLAASLLGCKKGGFFVDLAANDAISLSNSFMLERDFDWDGVCVEANPDYQLKLARRQCKQVMAAVGSPTGTKVNFDFKGGGNGRNDGLFGGIVGSKFDNKLANPTKTQSLYTVSLVDVLGAVGAPSTIDYFSLDVEGAESMVMEDFPFGNYTFLVLTVERPKDSLAYALARNGYHKLRTNSHFGDETWIHKTLPMFDEAMATLRNNMSHPDTCMVKLGHAWPSDLQD